MTEWDGRKLWEYEPETVVTGIPMSVFHGDKDMVAYVKRQTERPEWTRTIRELLRDFDPGRFEPLYYCLKCRRVEDGAHRFFVGIAKDMPTLSVRTGAECFKAIRPRTPLDMFEAVMRNTPGIGVKDHKWLKACAKDKWPHLKGVDFKGKRFLDVGCNTGYSCLEAHRRGAKFSLGLDIRDEVIKVAVAVKSKLGVSDEDVQFVVADWPDYQKGPFDIVSCMGLLHYFSVRDYGKRLAKLAEACNETLILELRITDSAAVRLMDKAGQTLPSGQWLTRALANLGFKVAKRVVRGPQRALWVARRK